MIFGRGDSIRFKDDLNLYAYVKNDPLDGVDPTGNDDSPWSMPQADARVREIHQTDPAFAAKADTVMAVATGVVAAGVGALAVAGAATAAAGVSATVATTDASATAVAAAIGAGQAATTAGTVTT